ncbi:MAG: mitochondrial fission ELM1 family protein [Planctomycetes bacterium]|nr:mitochondrial fission ELM1 family protein [Planctomycetota bacterium]
MTSSPRIWLLLGLKQGDNNQLRLLAESLGEPVVEKRLRYRAWELLVGRLLGATLAGTDRNRSDAIEPPWPDLVLSAGRRNEPIARWIKEASGGRCRIVHLGRPWSRPEHWDLVVTTPQYQVPSGSRVVEIALPLHRVDHARSRDAARRLQPALAGLPRPWTALLLGGNAGDFRLSGRRVSRLIAELDALLARVGGSLLVSSSARTPSGLVDTIDRHFGARARIYRFRPDDPDNPYAAYLALADRFVVTADSISMVVEAIASGRPVQVFDSRIGSRRAPWFLDRDGWRYRPLVQRLSRLLAPRRLRRDPMRIHRRLEAEGRIGWLGKDEKPAPSTLDDGSRDLELVTRRVRALLAAAPQEAASDSRG